MSDPYCLLELNWMDRDRKAASPDDDWAWTYITDMRGGTLPATWALVEDILHHGYVVAGDYLVTIARNKFLNRERIDV